MYGLDMYHTIKTLLEQGKSQRFIAEHLGIHRKTVKQIQERIDQGLGPPVYERDKKLNGYADQIGEYLKQDLSRVLIHRRLVEDHGLAVSYTTVVRFVNQLQGQGQSFVPMHSEAGEEAQVDFGYLGRFTTTAGRKVKVWCFSIVLSHSRYSYHEVVLDQRVKTFIRCHRNAFEYFGGVPRRVKLDNLKAGVIEPNFYEPILQEQYSEFLAHYGCAGVPCRVRKPEHKGKVESGVKYVKGNFVRGLSESERSWEDLQQRLQQWTDQICNQRVHGTTQRVPAEVFEQKERTALLPLPAMRYENFRWEERKVSRMGHISIDQNYYSVPYTLVGQQLTIKSNDNVVRIYAGSEEVALHELAQGKGQYITRQEHLPPHKREQSLEMYRQKMSAIGPAALGFMEACREHVTSHWRDKIRGVLSLSRQYEPHYVEQACQKALDHELYSYRSVRTICEHICRPPVASMPVPQIAQSNEGYHHDLAAYDQL